MNVTGFMEVYSSRWIYYDSIFTWWAHNYSEGLISILMIFYNCSTFIKIQFFFMFPKKYHVYIYIIFDYLFLKNPRFFWIFRDFCFKKHDFTYFLFLIFFSLALDFIAGCSFNSISSRTGIILKRIILSSLSFLFLRGIPFRLFA